MNIYEFAKEINVSIGTVSRAINNRKDVSPKTRQFVLQKMEELGYVPSRVASSLASGRSQTIAVWCPGLDSPFASEMLGRFEHVMQDGDYDIVVVDIAQKRQDFTKLGNFAQWPADGVIVMEGGEDGGWLSAFLQTPVGKRMPPLVSVGIYCDKSVDHVFLDLTEAAEDAVRHLLESDCRRIAFMSPTPYCDDSGAWTNVRYHAYEKVMREAGKAPELITFEDNYRALAVRAISEYVRKNGCPDGIFCFNDDTAIGAYRGLKDCGIKVPEHVLLVGCDGIREGEYMDHPLSTIAMPTEEMCKKAWQFLEKRIKKPDAPFQSAVIYPSLLLRETSRR